MTSIRHGPDNRWSGGSGGAPIVDIVIPVHNAAGVLDANVTRLCEYLKATFPLPWQVTIVDAGSTDDSGRVAQELAGRYNEVKAVRLDAEGRGWALRSVWEASEARVLAYIDVDLGTDLNAFLPLVAPLLSGHSDVAVGWRRARRTRLLPNPKWEFTPRVHSRLLTLALGSGLRDTQHGFKAVRAEVARVLLPAVRDNTWFFDTEFLVLAERLGLRIAELPVDWTDRQQSRPRTSRIAGRDLRRVWGLARTVWFGRVAVGIEDVAARRRPGGRGHVVSRFLRTLLCCSVLYLAVFLIMQPAVNAYWANGLALTATTLVCGYANRRYVPSRTASGPYSYRLPKAVAGYAASLVGTSAALKILFMASSRPSLAVQATVATVMATLVASVRLSFMFEDASRVDGQEGASNLKVDGSYA